MKKILTIFSVCTFALTPLLVVSTARAENFTIRIGFEEFAEQDRVHIVDQFSNQGIHFQDFGDGNGSISFETSAISPFGTVNWQDFPPFGLNEVGIPLNNGNQPNIRYINFDPPVSYISFWYTNGQKSPIFAWPVVTVWDGSDGTGNHLNDNPDQFKFFPGEQLPWNAGQKDLWEFDAEANIIQSISIGTVPNRIGIDDIVVKYVQTPLGGSIEVVSNLDGSTPPEIYLDGDPTFLGSSQGTSPVSLISVTQGTHLVTAYLPGYEWSQEYVTITDGVTTAVNAVMSPVETLVFSAEARLQSDGLDINGGGRAAPYLADYNDDGLVDLVVGNGISGDIKAYINTGTNEAPIYGAPQIILSGSGVSPSPIAIDFYTNGKIDLVVGYADGSVKVFYNEGTDTTPSFGSSAFDSTLITAPSGDAVPFMVDWNNDGKKDLLVGCADGNVYLYLNQRLDQSPDYSGAVPSIVTSVLVSASPAAVLDWDGDGKKDLLVGDGDGALHIFINQGTDDTPAFASNAILTDQNNVPLDFGANARPIIADYNADGVKDILIGNSIGEVIFCDGTGGVVDADGDGVLDDVDNCPNTPNPDQADNDGDGIGDVCDDDDDNDGVLDLVDNCPFTYNPDQADNDGDGEGDVCDLDDDNDGVLDTVDNCPFTANTNQADFDSDGFGDVCDPDDDNDGVLDINDNCPFSHNPDQADNDGDGLGDACDDDDDNDGVLDVNDVCPFEDSTGFDADGDGCIDTFAGLVDIIENMDDGILSDNTKNSLVKKVENAAKQTTKENIDTAINVLGAFKNEVTAQIGKKISQEAADLLLAYADSLIAWLTAQIPA